ncbi:MAG: hypothetical protein M3Q56_01520 [Bacteroidota bacterium]|nr:hypothetical protein [Bacteroidota bacterium]
MRKSAMSALEPKGQIGNFQSVTEQDSIFNSEHLKGNRWLITILGADAARETSSKDILKLFTQSNKDFNGHIFSIIGLFPGESMDVAQNKFNWPKMPNWKVSYMAEKHVYIFSTDAFEIPERLRNKPLAILVDENGRIRNYYDLSDQNKLMELVRHYPVFLSLKK